MTQVTVYSCGALPFEEQNYEALVGDLKVQVVDHSPRLEEWFATQCQQDDSFAAIVPAGFKAAALFFDMDATFVEEETLVEIAKRCGSYDKVKGITDRAMRGELDFEAALRERVATLRGHDAGIIATIAGEMRLTPGIEELLATARRHNWPVFLVSGGFIQLAGPLADRLGLAAYAANDLEIESGQFTGGLRGDIVDAKFKAKWLNEMCASRGINPKQAVAIGDGANDLVMMGEAGLAVGFRPKPALHGSINICNNRGDHGLTAVVLDHCQV